MNINFETVYTELIELELKNSKSSFISFDKEKSIGAGADRARYSLRLITFL